MTATPCLARRLARYPTRRMWSSRASLVEAGAREEAPQPVAIEMLDVAPAGHEGFAQRFGDGALAGAGEPREPYDGAGFVALLRCHTNLYFRMHHKAWTPSFHVIFLPSE